MGILSPRNWETVWDRPRKEITEELLGTMNTVYSGGRRRETLQNSDTRETIYIETDFRKNLQI